jgi:hypothetical protein
MDMQATLAWVLKRAVPTAEVHPFLKPEGASLPCLVYHVITDRTQDTSASGGGAVHLSRVQVDHIGSTPASVYSMVSAVQTTLEGNRTDFSFSLAADVHIERQDAEDIYVVTKDYFVQWKAN